MFNLKQPRHISTLPNSDVNVIRIISAKWKIWIVRGAGSKKLASRILEIAFSKELRRMKTEGRDHPAHAAKKGGSARYLAPVAASTICPPRAM